MDYAERQRKKSHPKDRGNILSNLFFLFTLGLFKKGFRKELNETDLYEIPRHLRSKKLGERLENQWKKQQTSYRSPSVLRLFLSSFGKSYLLLGVLQLFIDLCETFIPPYALEKVISYFPGGQNNITTYDAYYYAFVLIGFYFVQRVYRHNYSLLLLGLGIKIRTSFCYLIYQKLLKINSSFLEDFSIGKILNMYTKDADALEASLDFGNELWIGFIKIIVVLFILYNRIGMAAIAGLSTFFVSMPFQIYLGTKVVSLKTKMYEKTDKRLQVTQETLSAIKIIKLYVWEKIFGDKIASARKKEVYAMYKVFFMRHLILVIASINSYLAFYILIMTYVWLGNKLTAETVYFVSATFENLSFGLSVLFPNSVIKVAELISVTRRVENVLSAEELQHEEKKINGTTSPTIHLNNVTLTIKNKPIIQNLNFTFEQGLTIVTGSVGSGKSCMLKAILQEYQIDKGKLISRGNMSYASQEPWLFPSTIRQNILFGQKYDEQRYEEVLKVCDLIYDLKSFKEEDATIVEDRGINLSRGQQIRINLARAIYKKSEIYLLDDPLTGLDSHVSNYIFEECIRKFLRNKIIILITHNLNYAKNANNILNLNDKEISKTYNNSNIVKTNNEDKQKEEEHRKNDGQHSYHVDDITASESSSLILKTKIFKKVYKENQKIGTVKKKVYKQYINFGGGLVILIMTFTVFVFAQVVTRYTDKLLNNWVILEQKLSNYTINQSFNTNLKEYEEMKHERVLKLYLYSGIIVVTSIATLGKTFTLLFFTRRVSFRLYKKCISSIMNASMEFFDTNFIGNILNRLSKDLMEVDEFLPGELHHIFEILLTMIGTIVLIASVNISFLTYVGIFFILLVILRIVCLPTLRNLKRLDSITRSPLIGHVNATLEGLTTIKASKIEDILQNELHNQQDCYNTAMYTFYCNQQAFAFTADTLSVVFIALVMMKFLIKNDSSAADVGLAITQTIMMTRTLQWGIRLWTNLENRMTMVERVLEYTETKQETKHGLDLQSWPRKGRIQYENVYLAYTTSQEFTLLNVNFVVEPNEKIGIVGRTGAGKSSIILSLLRLYETEGKITIDDIDIKTLSLNLLRTKISIIPQDPVLFSGTIRENIDPGKNYPDEDVWRIIEMVHLKKLIPSLDFKIMDGGSNFSTGQKQLVCLARALLQNNKIVIFDEATATMDSETEKLIYQIIKQNFESCTVITVAHKLQTVLECDKVMVLDKGKIVEFDNPSTLLKNKCSIFYKMVADSYISVFK